MILLCLKKKKKYKNKNLRSRIVPVVIHKREVPIYMILKFKGNLCYEFLMFCLINNIVFIYEHLSICPSVHVPLNFFSLLIKSRMIFEKYLWEFSIWHSSKENRAVNTMYPSQCHSKLVSSALMIGFSFLSSISLNTRHPITLTFP